MARNISWLHLSDLHACKPKTGWDARRVIATLREDISQLREEYDLQPDFIFFTGDLSFGHIGEKDGKSISEQFHEGEKFLTQIRTCFEPQIAKTELFLVPGNHDVNRNSIPSFATQQLNQLDCLETIETWIRDNGTEWKALINRLNEYKTFLEQNGYEHCLEDADRLIYAQKREVGGIRIGIAGFNSAWSSTGSGREEKGKLWAAGRFQNETLQSVISDCHLKIALIHHPSNWLVPEEDPDFFRDLRRDFHFVLHGHEHTQFVEPNTYGNTLISAAACHEWSTTERNGYSFVRLDLDNKLGDVWLRKYDKTGGAWGPRHVAKKTDDSGSGIWPLDHLEPWISQLELAPTLDALHAAHLTMFYLMGYWYAFSINANRLRNVLDDFSTKGMEIGRIERLQLADEYLSEYQWMHAPLGGPFAEELKGTVEDKRFLVVYDKSGQEYAWGIIVRFGNDRIVVFQNSNSNQSHRFDSHMAGEFSTLYVKQARLTCDHLQIKDIEIAAGNPVEMSINN